MFAGGTGVAQDERQAVAWFRKAAEQGIVGAQVNLASRYASGRGVAQNASEAMRWYREAAEQGDSSAQYSLAAVYATGRGTAADPVEAHKWVSLAIARSSGDDQRRYATARDQLVTMLTPAQIEEAQKRAREWTAAFERRPPH
jgi:TPR repeat protein